MNIIETNLQFKSMDTRLNTNRIIVHHAAISNCTPEQIHQWHLDKGWSGAGYHFFVKKDGSIYSLRPEDKVGAHAYGANSDSIGMCAEGDFTKETMSDKQLSAMVELIKYIENKYSIKTIEKHSQVNATTCPAGGFPFDKMVERVNSESVGTEQNDIEKNKSNISQIQENINKKYGLNIAVDNIYGEETKGALVFALQKELNLQFNAGISEDKIFGPKTKAACINVKIGAQGNITYIIQSLLVIHGYDIKVDGIFGDETLNAVKEFQSKSGLSVDGIVGPNTMEMLFSK